MIPTARRWSEKYPEKCPWDNGPDQTMSARGEWILRFGTEAVRFSKNKLDHHYFHIFSNGHEEQVLAFRARLLYQKLLDKGYKLEE